jgi:hypothetical protein
VEANSTGGQGSRRAVAPSDDDDDSQLVILRPILSRRYSVFRVGKVLFSSVFTTAGTYFYHHHRHRRQEKEVTKYSTHLGCMIVNVNKPREVSGFLLYLWGYAVAPLVEALRYKPEDGGVRFPLGSFT